MLLDKGSILLMLNFFSPRAYGNTKNCRKVLQRALNSVTDWPQMIVDAYLRFEREEGKQTIPLL